VPLSFIPFHTLLGRTHGVEELSAEENLKHTAVFRLALGRSIRNLQASWVKMGLDAATGEPALGRQRPRRHPHGESISRMAGSAHGTRLDPEDLIAPRTGPAGPPRAHDALRHPEAAPRQEAVKA
jgi:FO synthase